MEESRIDSPLGAFGQILDLIFCNPRGLGKSYKTNNATLISYGHFPIYQKIP